MRVNLCFVCLMLLVSGLSGQELESESGEEKFWEAVGILEFGEESTMASGRKMLRRAANESYAPAQYFIGVCNRFGLFGFSENKKRGVSWLKLSANQGHAHAMSNLGQCYYFGEGVRKDLVKAKQWLSASLAEDVVWIPLTPPDDVMSAMQERSAEQIAGVESVTDMNQATVEENVQAFSYFLLGIIEQESGAWDRSHEFFMTAAFFGEMGRAGVADAAVQSAIDFALGRGIEINADEASRLLVRSSELKQKQGSHQAFSLLLSKKMNDMEAADFAEMVAEVNEEQLQTIQFDIAENLAAEKLESYNLKEAARWYAAAAESGSALAKIKLAYIYTSGDLGEIDQVRAFELFLSAAEDHLLAAANLGICYQYGFGVEQNSEEAMKWFHKYKNKQIVCYLGSIGKAPGSLLNYDQVTDLCIELSKTDSQAQYLMGLRFENGWGVKKSEKKALKFYKKAAKQNNPAAMVRMGLEIQKLAWSEKNHKKSVQYFKKAYDAGNAEAAFRLSLAAGAIYVGGQDEALEYAKEALAREPDTGLYHLRLAMVLEQRARPDGDLPAYVRAMVEELRVSGKLAQDATIKINTDPLFSDEERAAFTEEMMVHYKAAAEQGVPMAYYKLGELYYADDFGPDQDFEEAYVYYQDAAEEGILDAYYKLGQMHHQGEGIPVTLEEAAYYYMQAAAGGHGKAVEVIARFYLNGTGVTRDLDRAQHWLVMLAESGDEEYLIALGNVMMERQDYTEAQKLFRKLVKHPLPEVESFAYVRLAEMYQNGFGVKVNKKSKQRYLKKALQIGSTEALVFSGKEKYDNGNLKDAMKLYRTASLDGDSEANFLLGKIYVDGAKGIEQDFTMGWALIKRSARGGYNPAKLRLALSSLNGTAGAPGLDEAIQFAKEAEAANVPSADTVRRELEQKRTKAEPSETSSNGSQSG